MARSSSAPRDSSDCPPANRCWKPDEDDLLRQAVQKYGPGKWALAAQSVPGRSNHQVRQRWMFYLDPTINKQPLTDAEYNIILREQSQIGNKWMDIARLLPGRTYCFISDTWYNSIRRKVVRYLAEKRNIGKLQVPSLDDGRFEYQEGELEGALSFVLSKVNRSKSKLQRWTPTEDSVLREAVKLSGTEWVKVASAVPGRTNRQCRLRWANHLDPRVKKSPLTEQELRVMIECHSKMGNKWADIVKFLPGRTDEFVKYNWCNKIFGKIVHYLTQAREIDKKQLQCTESGSFDYRPGELEGAISFVLASVQKAQRKRSRPLDDDDASSSDAAADSPQAKRAAISNEGDFLESPVAIVETPDSPKSKRAHRSWKLDEDNLLRHNVQKYGQDWSLVSSYIQGRSKQQCSYRWINHLEPNVKKAPFSSEEYRIFLESHANLGNKWVDIAKLLPGRTPSCIANLWNSSIKRKVVEYLVKERGVVETDIAYHKDGRTILLGDEFQGALAYVLAGMLVKGSHVSVSSDASHESSDENDSSFGLSTRTTTVYDKKVAGSSPIQWSLKPRVDDAAIQLLRMRQGS